MTKTSVYVVIGSWGDDDNAEDVDHVAVYSSRRAAEKDATEYIRARANGRTVRGENGTRLRLPPIQEDDDSTIAVARVVRRTVK